MYVCMYLFPFIISFTEKLYFQMKDCTKAHLWIDRNTCDDPPPKTCLKILQCFQFSYFCWKLIVFSGSSISKAVHHKVQVWGVTIPEF